MYCNVSERRNKVGEFLQKKNVVSHSKRHHRHKTVLNQYEAAVLEKKPKRKRQNHGICCTWWPALVGGWLMAHLEARHSLPSHRFLADMCLPALYDMVTTHARSLIDNKVIQWAWSVTTVLCFCDYLWFKYANVGKMLSFFSIDYWLQEEGNYWLSVHPN